MSSGQKVQLMVLDILTLLLSFSLVYFLRIGHFDNSILAAPGLWAILALTFLFLYILGAYDFERETTLLGMLSRNLLAVMIALVLVVLINFVAQKSRAGIFGRGVLLGSLVLFWIISSGYRIVFLKWIRVQYQRLQFLVIAGEKYVDRFWSDLVKNKMQDQFYFLVKDHTDSSVPAQNLAGVWSDLNLVLNKKWARVIIAMNDQDLTQTQSEELMKSRLQGQKMMDLTLFYEYFWKKIPVYFLQPQWFINSTGFSLSHNPIGLRIKRLLDLVLSLILLLFTWPIMLIFALLIRIESQGPALFTQIRTGLDGKDFVIYKFRSMRIDAEKDGAVWAQKNDSRVTRIGKLIRLTRIDELPQLFNVIRGEMSFIGPRPERPEFNHKLEKQIPFYNLRHMIPPGLTGWAQVLYPYGASVEDSQEKLQYELFYIKNYSLLLDLRIVLKTVRIVLFGRGR